MAVSLQIESVLHRVIFVILSQEKDNDGGSRSSSPALGSVVIWGRGLGGSRGGDPPPDGSGGRGAGVASRWYSYRLVRPQTKQGSVGRYGGPDRVRPSAATKWFF